MAEDRAPVGIITRADATSAGRVLGVVKQLAEEGARTLATLPAQTQAALDHVRDLERSAEQGRLTMAQAEAAQDLIEGLRTEAAQQAAQALESSGRLRGAQGLTKRVTDLARANDEYKRAYGHQWRAEQLREAIDRIERLTARARPEDVGDGASPPTITAAGEVFEGDEVDLQANPGAGPGGPAGGPPVAPGGPRRPPAGPQPGGGPRERLPHLPSLYPGSRRQSPGTLPDPRLTWAERYAMSIPGRIAAGVRSRLRLVSRLASALSGMYVANAVVRSGRKAEGYETGISLFAIQRGLLTGEMGRDEGNFLSLGGFTDSSGHAPEEPSGVIRLRRSIVAMRTLFLATGEESLKAMRGLGAQYTDSRLMTSVGTARALGLPVEHVANWSRRMHERTVGQRQDTPVSPATGRPINLGDAMAYAGMRDRPELFMEDVDAYVGALAPGQRMQDYATGLGLAGLIGGMSLGGQRRETGTGLIRGTAREGNDFELSAKVDAVRRFLGKTTVGGGNDATTYDPASFRQARELIATGDPRVTWAIARWAEQYAGTVSAPSARNDTGITIFERLTHLSAAQAERVWRERDKLRNVGVLASDSTEADRAWMNGPLYRGRKDGKPAPESASFREWLANRQGSIADAKASIDHGEWKAGRVVLNLTTHIKLAMEIAAAGLGQGKSFTDAFGEAIDSMDDDTARLVMATSALRGGTFGIGTAAAVAVRRGLSSVRNLRGNIQNWTNSVLGVPQPNAGATILNPVPGATLGDDLGAERWRNGHFDHAHRGLDLVAPEGTPVQAAGGGTVSLVRDRQAWEASNTDSGRAAGISVWINHPDGTQTRYMHLNEIAFNPETGRPFARGDVVRPGTEIGTVGNTGAFNTGAHLHFELRGQADAQGNRQPLSPSEALGVRR